MGPQIITTITTEIDTNDLLKDLESLFRNVFKDESIILTSSTTANDIEEWTSLTNMLLINEIENEYNIKFKFREIINLKDVGELYDAIILKMKQVCLLFPFSLSFFLFLV